jgi:hypothetical protein
MEDPSIRERTIPRNVGLSRYPYGEARQSVDFVESERKLTAGFKFKAQETASGSSYATGKSNRARLMDEYTERA